MALSEAQLRARCSGFGGTDMVAICGESNYRGPIDVYLEKRHGLGLPIPTAPPSSFAGNERTDWGHILEPVIAQKYADDTGLHLVEPPMTFRHPELSWMLGTPDRLCYEEPPPLEPTDGPMVLDASTGAELYLGNVLRIWEGKTHGMMAAKKYDLENMSVPDDKKIQVAWYRALTGIKEAELSALIDTHLYRVFRIEHDQAVEDYLLEEAELFWKKIQDGVEPEPDGTEMFSDYLKGRFARQVDDMVEVDAETLREIASYKVAKADKKVSVGKMDLAKQRIQLAIGHHQGLLLPTGKPAVTWKRKASGSCSYAKLAAELRDEGKISDKRFDELKDEYTGEPGRNFLVK